MFRDVAVVNGAVIDTSICLLCKVLGDASTAVTVGLAVGITIIFVVVIIVVVVVALKCRRSGQSRFLISPFSILLQFFLSDEISQK